MKKRNPVKYIFVLGGVLSGLGKGIRQFKKALSGKEEEEKSQKEKK